MPRQRATAVCSLGDGLARGYFFLILIFLPLYMDKNFYTAMIDAKGTCYTMIAVLLLACLAVYFVYSLIKKTFLKPAYPIAFNLLDMAVVLFTVTVCIAWLGSEDKRACFWGTNGFRCGTFMVLTGMLFYAVFSRTLNGHRKLWDMVFLVADGICIWVFLNAASVDLLNMHAQIRADQYFGYFACLGQLDSVSAYLCLLLPVGILFFVNAVSREDCIFYGTFIGLGLLALFNIQTDGVYIGIVVCGIFLFPYLFHDYKRVERMLYLGILAGGELLLRSILQVLVPERMNPGPGVSMFLFTHWIGIFLIVICVLALFLLRRFARRISVKGLALAGRCLSIAMLLLIAGYGVYSVFHFNTSWGNGRGSIWSACVKMFQAAPTHRKLFGYGTEMIREELTPLVNWGVGVANAHNNILEALLCLGLFGLLAYLFLWGTIVAPFFKGGYKTWSVERTAYFMSLVAYFGQSIVGNPYSLSMPIAFLMLMLYRNAVWTEETKHV